MLVSYLGGMKIVSSSNDLTYGWCRLLGRLSGSYLGLKVIITFHADISTLIKVTVEYHLCPQKGERLTSEVSLDVGAAVFPIVASRALFLIIRGSPLFKARSVAVLLRRRAKESDDRDITAW